MSGAGHADPASLGWTAPGTLVRVLQGQWRPGESRSSPWPSSGRVDANADGSGHCCPDGSQFALSLPARTVVVRRATCAAPASLGGTDADTAVASDLCGKGSASCRPRLQAQDEVLHRSGPVPLEWAARCSRLATAWATLARKCLRHG